MLRRKATMSDRQTMVIFFVGVKRVETMDLPHPGNNIKGETMSDSTQELLMSVGHNTSCELRVLEREQQRSTNATTVDKNEEC